MDWSIGGDLQLLASYSQAGEQNAADNDGGQVVSGKSRDDDAGVAVTKIDDARLYLSVWPNDEHCAAQTCERTRDKHDRHGGALGIYTRVVRCLRRVGDDIDSVAKLGSLDYPIQNNSKDDRNKDCWIQARVAERLQLCRCRNEAALGERCVWVSKEAVWCVDDVVDEA